MDYSKRCQQPNPNPRSVSWVDKAWQKDRLAEPHLLFSSAEHWRWSQPEHWCALRCCVIEDKVILKGFTRLSRTATPLKPSCSAHASKPCRGLYSCPASDPHPARFSQALFPLISVPGWSSRSSSHTPSTSVHALLSVPRMSFFSYRQTSSYAFLSSIKPSRGLPRALVQVRFLWLGA